MRRGLVALGLLGALLPSLVEARGLIVQSTTSTANSGLYEHLLPRFEAATGIAARVVAVGTGQALRNARNCDGDVVLVHARAAEEAFVAAGHGLERRDVMYNDFVLVGPRRDPAGLDAATSAAEAFARIAKSRALFVSRGDDSGTHRKELSVWVSAGGAPEPASARWYRETGSGMGATLNIAAGMDAYALTDRATWTAFANKGGLRLLFEGDPALFNPYGVIVVNPERCPDMRAREAQAFSDWLVSDEGQAAIGSFRLEGRPMFVPNAAR